MRAYRMRRPNGTWTNTVETNGEMEKAVHRRMARIDGPVHLSEDGDPWGPWITRGEGTDRLINKAETGQVGHAYRLWNKEQKGVTLRIVEVAPDPANTGGSPGVDILVGFLNERFPHQWEQWGIYVYKHIAGSGTWSDHSYVWPGHWCGRAIDVHPYSMSTGDQIKAAAMAEPTITAHLRYLLWRVPSHYDHLHFSFEDGGWPGSCS